MHKIGIISDTHGMLRPEIAAVFAETELIIHAGDIGSSSVITELNKIAPVTAVYGNTDKALWAHEFPASAAVAVGDIQLYVLHNLAELDFDPAAAGFAGVVYGHTHEQACETRGSVLYFNPGSAGPQRSRLQASVGLITIENSRAQGKIISLPETARYC